jgi:CHASE2 domain-containing sensor protein
MKLTLASAGTRTPPTNIVLLTVVVLLMLGGAALLVAGAGSAGIWIPIIAIGIALTVIVQRGSARRRMNPDR